MRSFQFILLQNCSLLLRYLRVFYYFVCRSYEVEDYSRRWKLPNLPSGHQFHFLLLAVPILLHNKVFFFIFLYMQLPQDFSFVRRIFYLKISFTFYLRWVFERRMLRFIMKMPRRILTEYTTIYSIIFLLVQLFWKKNK